MQVEDPHQSIYWNLMQLMFQSKHRLYEIAEKYDLTMMQSSSLMMLSEDDPKAMRALSNNFMCDASTVTGLVDRLEARKLISRSNHPTDRRVKLIALTSQGAAIKAAILAETLKVEDERLHQILTPAEQKTFEKLVKTLLAEEPSKF
jgi:DNA-binding MarR family transcriptional regulator